MELSSLNQSKPKEIISFWNDIRNRLLDDIGTPVAKKLKQQFQNGEKLDLKIDPASYISNPKSYLLDAQAIALFKKDCSFSSSSTERNDKAFLSFVEAEVQCGKTNDFFKTSRDRPRFEEEWHVLYTAQNILSGILNKFHWEKTDLNFGPGSNVKLSGSKSSLSGKLQNQLMCSTRCLRYIKEVAVPYFPGYLFSTGVINSFPFLHVDKQRIEVIDYDELLFVPKTSETSRTICRGPVFNMVLQKGVASYLKNCLKHSGLVINETPEAHATYVEYGSVYGGISTIDLSSASDTISYEFVKFMFDGSADTREVFDIMCDLRLSKTISPYGTFELNKFSAMGNGFTFELETLLFYCLGLAVKKIFGRKRDIVSSFGDDIIVSNHLSSHLIRTLVFSGFSVNTDKTFLTGSFFESCGEDYMLGCRVRPIYLKFPEVQEVGKRKDIEWLYYLANRIREIAYRCNFSYSCDIRFRHTWLYVLQRIPCKFRFFGPTFEYSIDIGSRAGSDQIRHWIFTKSREQGDQLSYFGDKCLIGISGRPSVDEFGSFKLSTLHTAVDNKDKVQVTSIYQALLGLPSSGEIPRRCKYKIVKRSLFQPWEKARINLAWQ